MTGHDPFAVNEDRERAALMIAWGDFCDRIWVSDGQCPSAPIPLPALGLVHVMVRSTWALAR